MSEREILELQKKIEALKKEKAEKLILMSKVYDEIDFWTKPWNGHIVILRLVPGGDQLESISIFFV